MLRKNWEALGSSSRQDRPRSIDLLGFASQLMFTTALLNYSSVLEGGRDVELTYAVARAHTRHMVEFCSVDRRLLPTGYVPLVDFERTARAAREAIELGAKALMIPSRCPDGHSPSHIGFDPLWAVAQEAGLPIVSMSAAAASSWKRPTSTMALPPVPDFHGGDDNFKSIDYMAIAYPPMKALTALVVDRVLDRFPQLKFGVIEQGASWVPGWMRNMDSAPQRLLSQRGAAAENVAEAQRVRAAPGQGHALSARGYGLDHRQHRRRSLPLLLRLSACRGRPPSIKRFEASMEKAGTSEAQKQRFYSDNFIDLMGAGLAPELRHPIQAAA